MNDTEAPAPMYIGGEGTPLVLLHGICGTWEIWKPVLPALERQYRVIAVTLPGHHGGQPYAADGDATITGIVDQLIKSLRTLGIERAHVAGNSLGGWLALELARREFAKSVIAFSPAGGWVTDRDYRAIARSFKLVYASIDFLRLITSPAIRFPKARKFLTKQMMEHGDRIPETQFRAFLRAMSNTVILPGLLRTIGVDGPIAAFSAKSTPIRIAWSECDHVIPFERYGATFEKRIRGAEITTVPGVGHVPIFDDPQRIVTNIMQVASFA